MGILLIKTRSLPSDWHPVVCTLLWTGSYFRAVNCWVELHKKTVNNWINVKYLANPHSLSQPWTLSNPWTLPQACTLHCTVRLKQIHNARTHFIHVWYILWLFLEVIMLSVSEGNGKCRSIAIRLFKPDTFCLNELY